MDSKKIENFPGCLSVLGLGIGSVLLIYHMTQVLPSRIEEEGRRTVVREVLEDEK